MRLMEVWHSLLKEIGETGIAEDDNVVEFPHQNFTLSIFKTGKKLVFTPQQHGSITTQMKSYVDMIYNNFLISDMRDLGGGAFELIVDPREDFDAVVDFISGQLDRERM